MEDIMDAVMRIFFIHVLLAFDGLIMHKAGFLCNDKAYALSKIFIRILYIIAIQKNIC